MAEENKPKKNWSLQPLGGSKGYRVWHKQSPDFNKTLKTRQEAIDWKNATEATLVYDDDGTYLGIKKTKIATDKAPTELEKSTERVISQQFTDPVQARSDSSRIFKAGGGDQYEPAGDVKKREEDELLKLRSRNVTVNDKIKKLNQWIRSNKPEHVAKRKQYEAELAGFEQELASNYEKLDIPYNPDEPVDASPDTGGFLSGVGDVLSSVGDFFTPSDEETFTANYRDKLQRGIVERTVTVPEKWKSNPSKWVAIEADKAWESKQNQKPLEEQSIDELIKNAGN